MFRNLIFLTPILAIFLCFGCNQQDDKINNVGLQNDSASIFTQSSEDFNELNKIELLPCDTSITLHFKDFSLKICNLICYDKLDSTIVSDTCGLWSEMGYRIEGQQIFLLQNTLKKISIEQCYETTLSVSNEGPHCDLINWEHFLSDWKPLLNLGENTYYFPFYTDSEKRMFPNIPLNSFKEKVKEHCGDDYYQLIKNNNSISEGASDVSISTIFLRIRGEKNGNKIEKIIIIEISQGC